MRYFQSQLTLAKKGNADAQWWVGASYFTGGVIESFKEAVYWLALSAQQGNAYAQSDLGFCYEKGKGVEKDLKEAIRFYQLSTQQGNAKAQFNLAVCYADGLVEQ